MDIIPEPLFLSMSHLARIPHTNSGIGHDALNIPSPSNRYTDSNSKPKINRCRRCGMGSVGLWGGCPRSDAMSPVPKFHSMASVVLLSFIVAAF